MLLRRTNTLLCRRSFALLAPANPNNAASSSTTPAGEASSSSSTNAATTTTSVSNERIANIFANRRNPSNLFRPGMHSGTLSDHPITLKVAKDELDYRQRKLIEKGDYESAADAEIEAEERNLRADRSGIKETNEYRWVLFFVAAGYFTAHLVVYKYFYPDEMRLPYDPQRGYIDAIERKKVELESLDEMVGGSVLQSVFDSKKALLKSKAQKHWAELSGASV